MDRITDTKYLKLLSDYDVHCLHVQKSTAIDISESPEEKAKRIANLEKSYIRWFEYYFPHYAKTKSAKYHSTLANIVILNRILRLLAEIFRSGAKSVHLCMGIPLYLYFVLRELFFMLLIGETDPKAKKLLSGIQAELEHNQRLKSDYGDRYKKGDWSDGDFYTTDGVRFNAIGFGMSPRGLRQGANRPDYIVIDDVDTKKHVNNDELMQFSVDFITEEIEGCFDADDRSPNARERLIYSNNNFHKNSITNRLKQQFLANKKADEDNGDASIYHVVTVTAVKDLINFESAWPEKTSNEYWRKKFMRNPRSFMRENMHMHVQDGKIFKQEYMQWKKMLPLNRYDALIMYGDLSYKDEGDYKSMYLVGKTGRELHVIHSFCRQTSRTQVARWVYDKWEDRNLSNTNVKIKIEGLFAMDEFVSEFDNEGDARGYHIPVIADKRPKANKYDRIESMEGYFIRGWVFFNEAEKDHRDQITTIDQLLGFSKGSKMPDDGPDGLQGAFEEANKETFQETFTPRFQKRDMMNKRF